MFTDGQSHVEYRKTKHPLNSHLVHSGRYKSVDLKNICPEIQAMDRYFRWVEDALHIQPNSQLD